MIEYQGYKGTYEYIPKAKAFYGIVTGIKDVITFEARQADQVEAEFRESIEDYLQWCAELGERPCPPVF
ncbi:MAG: hypothetical protein CL946_03800 [Ectothiorhodospiraceae bacterium]|nr:hypothetical protein [Ectothiorhodospiraceae bacterium]